MELFRRARSLIARLPRSRPKPRWLRPARITLHLQALSVSGRMGASVHRAEQAGLAFVFSFYARCIALAVVLLWLLLLVPAPRNLYYAWFPAAFFLLGSVPFHLRRHRRAEAIKLVFVVLDVALVTAAILLPPPPEIAIDWPIQIRLRGHVFLFLLLLLGEAALTYSPVRVLWTGMSIVALWSLGTKIIYDLPGTVRLNDVIAAGRTSDAELLGMYVDPGYVSLASWSAITVSTILLTLLLSLAVLRGRLHLLAEAKSDVVRSDLARYVSPDIAGLVESQASPDFGTPVSRAVAVLFADIVGFTSLTEHLPPERTFVLLRSFQERSASVVIRHGGTLDKYLGDGLIALFGALQDEEDAARRAIACAFALQVEVERWNLKRRLSGAQTLRMAVGLHYGRVVVGHLGSEQRLEFTVVGDVVNVASRLEKATRELRCSLVVSDACLLAAGPVLDAHVFRGTSEIRLRGRSAPLAVHIA